MIHTAKLLHIVGQFLLVLSSTMLIPLIYGLWIGDDAFPFVYSVLITGITGGLIFIFTKRTDSDLTQREGILLVFTIWVASSLFGSFPFFFSPHFTSLTDAFFESSSGFTTTGATILSDVEVLSNSLQFWRCLTHWLGGMGIVLLGIAILPLVGIGGMPLYRAEFSGAKAEKLKPRIIETALALWKIYFALTLAAYLALRWAGLNSFDAVCHSFTAIATGGFSTRTASIAAFDDATVECIIIIFMLLAGINFTLHYRLWVEHRFRTFLSDVELRFYLIVAGVASVAILICLILRDQFAPLTALRRSVFQVCSIMTGTGLVTDNYETWSSFPQIILLALMFFGGCTGSTTGGLKASRILLLLKVVGREFKRMVERRGVFAVRLGSKVLPEGTIQSLLNLIYLALLTNIVSCILLSVSGVNVLSSIAATVACMFNIGPGFDHVGPVSHYGTLPVMAKWVLSGCMLAGRLEFYTVLVIFTRAFWRH